jgi:hypothetical protein
VEYGADVRKEYAVHNRTKHTILKHNTKSENTIGSVVPKIWFANPQGFTESSKGFARKQSITAAVLIVTDIIFEI